MENNAPLGDVCANCGKIYEHHWAGTGCYPTGVSRWFPKRLADALGKWSSAHAEPTTDASAAEQGGGGGGLRPLSAPAPEGITIREATIAVAATEDDGCLVRLTPADILNLKREQRAIDRRSALLIQLIFAARELAQGRLDEDCCRDCQGPSFARSGYAHFPSCRAARVLDILGALELTAPDADGAQGGAR